MMANKKTLTIEELAVEVQYFKGLERELNKFIGLTIKSIFYNINWWKIWDGNDDGDYACCTCCAYKSLVCNDCSKEKVGIPDILEDYEHVGIRCPHKGITNKYDLKERRRDHD